ncbi:MAG: hypothetical protein AB1473_22340 [Thermodesulfobacteriota bacterium]
MKHMRDNFGNLFLRAQILKAQSKYEDAAELLERLLRVTVYDPLGRYTAQAELAHCCIMLGRFPEAMAHLGEVYACTKDNPTARALAFWAYVQQIETLRCMQEALGNETEANVGLRVRLIEDALAWLKRVRLQKWNHALLFQKGIALWALSKREEALATMERAYRLHQKHQGPGYSAGTYVWRVAMFSWELGYLERGLQVLDQAENIHEEPLVQVQMLVQRVRLLRSLSPPAMSDALAAARRMIELLRHVQHPRIEAFAYAEWAYSAIDAKSLKEASEALTRLRDLVLKEKSVNRLFLAREACKAFLSVKDLLIGNKQKSARPLRQLAAGALKTVEREEVTKWPTCAPDSVAR